MDNNSQNKETPYKGTILNGFLMLIITFLILAGCALSIALAATASEEGTIALGAIVAVVLGISLCIVLIGFFVQQPNQSRVMIFFGNYRGTFRGTGFFWVNPFMKRKSISLRINNMNIEPIKVNDRAGNPVMIGMVLVWKVCDTYRSVFDIDQPADVVKVTGNEISVNKTSHTAVLDSFVRIQGDAALREVTSHFEYDSTDGTDKEDTLLAGGQVVNNQLVSKINDRVAMAGIEVIEARINYLAYAPEIAAVMLRRQQASAIIAAREKIVEGAVSMVKMALDELKDQGVVELDEERKATMVSNLLVVLCADEPAQPVVNTGSLYN